MKGFLVMMAMLLVLALPLPAATISSSDVEPINGSFWSSEWPELGESRDGEPVPGTLKTIIGDFTDEVLVSPDGESPGTFLFGAGKWEITLIDEISSMSGVNSLFWALSGDPNIQFPIFSGPDGPGATNTVNATGLWFLVLTTGQNNVFRSDIGTNFLATRGSQGLIVGIEDLSMPCNPKPGGSDCDYQDLRIGLQPPPPAPVPEPASVMLMGAGILALVGIARRKHRRQQ